MSEPDLTLGDLTIPPNGPIPLDALWYAALGQPLGIWLRLRGDPARVKSLLYAARRRLNDPSLAHLEIRTSPQDPRGTLWIINPSIPSSEG